MQTLTIEDLKISNQSISHHDFKLSKKCIWKPHRNGKNGIEIRGYQQEEELSDYKPFNLRLNSTSDSTTENCYSQLKKISGNSLKQDAHVLVMLNPKSGKGDSQSMFEKTLKPLMEEFALSYELFVTKRAKEAEDYLQSVENLLDKYSAVVIVSGDGLLFEVIQGLFQRSDIDEVIKKLPIGIVPGGTGNGLAKSLAHYNEENYSFFHSCLNVVAGKSSLMDLIEVKLDNGQVLHSFLSIGYGFTSDCDIESEYLRFLGDIRFEIYSLWLLLLLRSYHARITYKLANQSELTETEDDFVFIYCIKQPWVASSIFVAPSAKIDDGTMWLLLIRRRLVNRFKIFKIMLGFENAQYLNVEGVELLPVTYFKLETLSHRSYITVDGELLDNEVKTVEAKIVPKSLSILTK